MSFDAEGGSGGGASRTARVGGVLRAVTSKDGALAAADLRAALGSGPFALVLLFVPAARDPAALARGIEGAFGDAPVIGAVAGSTIGPGGAASGDTIALALDASSFAASVRVVEGLEGFRRADGEAIARRMLAELSSAGQAPRSRFGLMFADAAAMREEALAFAFGGSLGGAPFIGGSFAPERGEGFVMTDGRVARSAAAVAYIDTDHGLETLRLDDFEAASSRAVVTACDDDDRTVRELNGEPAVGEYARLLGIEPSRLTADVVSEHPMGVSVGGTLHVRGLRRVEGDALVFSSAVEEGMILRLVRSLDVVSSLEARLGRLARPQVVLAFDDVLRAHAAELSQGEARVSEILSRANACGFVASGQQHGRLHSNGAFVGLGLRPPEAGAGR